MPQVQVTIDGRSYRLACNPGDEEHLTSLAGYVDGKIKEMHGAFRDIGDQRIVVMAALSVTDELFEARKKAEGSLSDSEGATMRANRAAEALASETEAREAAQRRLAALETAIAEATARIEALAEGDGGRTEA